jgi:hypothetical protein
MKSIAIAGLVALALGTTAAGCRPHMWGMMMQGMGEQSSSENPSSAKAMMGHMPGNDMMREMMQCCEQCPMMNGKGSPTQMSGKPRRETTRAS